MEITKVSGLLAVTGEMLNDRFDIVPFFAEQAEWVSEAMREVDLDRVHGPRLGPGRNQWWDASRRARRADSLRLELARMGRPAGAFVSR